MWIKYLEEDFPVKTERNEKIYIKTRVNINPNFTAVKVTLSNHFQSSLCICSPAVEA
uniref:Uncharacterized protein n=1 Tax=Sphaeramia orbicularis TaxID=375764 RepID=A0A673CST3_9TELE